MFVRCGAGFDAGANLYRAAAAENVKGRGRGDGREAGGFEDRLQFAGADDRVHFGDALADFVAVALDETAGDDELFCPAGALVPRHL